MTLGLTCRPNVIQVLFAGARSQLYIFAAPCLIASRMRG
jgi:hypothetical protein